MSLVIAALCASASAASAQTPSGGDLLANQGRFAVLNQLNGEAVLDRETGLVWQQAPRADPFAAWDIAQRYCTELVLGNRRGWRLPTIEELESLTDASESNPTLTAGHPFVNVDLGHFYWSATAEVSDPHYVWSMTFTNARTSRGFRCLESGGCGVLKVPLAAWCVRGGTDAQ